MTGCQPVAGGIEDPRGFFGAISRPGHGAGKSTGESNGKMELHRARSHATGTESSTAAPCDADWPHVAPGQDGLQVALSPLRLPSVLSCSNIALIV